MTKAEQIAAKEAKPIEVGDKVAVRVTYTKTTSAFEGKGKNKKLVETKTEKTFDSEGNILGFKNGVYTITMGSINVPSELNDILPTSFLNNHDKVCLAKPEHVFPTFDECGSNPFGREKRRISFYNQEISSVLLKAGYGRWSDDFSEMNRKDVASTGKTYGGINFNPYIVDGAGKRQYYQRELVWTLEQKQLLLESIYQGIEIGKFLFRMNPWEKLEKEMNESGHGYNYDCVDGKQRFYAILHFLQNQYPDAHGNYWRDLSSEAHWRFMSYGNLSYGELPETATDHDVVDNFLTLNHSGTPMSPEHLAYVKSINMGKY